MLYLLDQLLLWAWWRLPAQPRVVELVPPVAGLVGYGLLMWRRSRPVQVFAAVWAFTTTSGFLPRYQPYLACLAALFAVASRRPVRVSAVALGSLVVPLGVLGVPEANTLDPGLGPMRFVFATLLWWLIALLVWAVGLRFRAHTLRLDDLERRRQAATEEAVAAERLRLAHDLHDILAHSVSVMVLQAAGARRVIDTDPGRAEAALQVIEHTGQQAMQELRRLLTVLRASGSLESAESSGQHGLDDIRDLTELARTTGMAVTTASTGVPQPMDASVQLAAYRVVQESLTNTRKHVGEDARVEIHLDWRPAELVLTIDDAAGGRSAPARSPDPELSSGFGLAGLGERVNSVEGTFRAAPRPGGFRVVATLPVSTVGVDATVGHPPADRGRDG